MATERFEMRLEEELLAQVDRWRATRNDVPTRSEAVRRLIELGLVSDTSKDAVKFTDGEKLIFGMLRDLYKHLEVEGEIDPEFMMEVISGGHYWAPKWDMIGLFHDYKDSPHRVREAADYLDMWSFIERGYKELSQADKKILKKDAEPFGERVTFPGFDGNNESEYLGIARIFINHMDRWQMFKGRDLNSHFPTLDMYQAMYRVFEPMRKTLVGMELNVKQLIAILSARKRSR
jgi:uncharacterized protein YfbU (UPF0304 family)